MKHFILAVVVTLLSFATPVFASESTPKDAAGVVADCQREVAFSALQLANAIMASDKSATIEVNPKEVESDGKSASAYVMPISTGGNALVLGKDVWVVPAHVKGKGHKETFVIQTTTTTNIDGECRVLAMTMVDHIKGR